MDFCKLFLILSLLTLAIMDLGEARRSRSKNSISKRNEKLRKMKMNNNEIKKRKRSKNAFRNSDIVKTIHRMEEELEEIAEEYDEEYYDDAPIINIRFTRSILDDMDSAIFTPEPINNSLLLAKLRRQ